MPNDHCQGFRTDRHGRGIRALNVTLLTLLAVATVSGVVAFGVGGSLAAARWVVAVHGASGLGLLLLAPAKIPVARRGLRRPGRSRKVLSLTFTVLTAIGSGLLHAVGGWRPYLWAAPDAAPRRCGGRGAGAAHRAHGVASPERPAPVAIAAPHRPNRRRALVGTGVVAGSAALWVIAPGLPRRATGSHEVGSGNIAVAGHAMDVRPGAPDRAGSLAPPNP